MSQPVLNPRKLQDAVLALEQENKRLREKIAEMVTPLQVARELPRRGSYLIGRQDGSLLCSGKRPLNISQVANAILDVDGTATVTIFRLIPWRTVHVDRVSHEWIKHRSTMERFREVCNTPDEPQPAIAKKQPAPPTRKDKFAEIDEILGMGVDPKKVE